MKEESGVGEVKGGAARLSMYGYVKQRVTWGNSVGAVGGKGRESKKEREKRSLACLFSRR